MACDIELAAFNLAHEYGIKKLAAELDMSPNVLNKQVDPGVDSHRLSLATANRIQRITGRPAILKAMADDLGYMVAKKPDLNQSNGDGLFDSLLDLSDKLGSVSAKLKAIYQDRKITSAEAKEFDAQIVELLTTALNLSLEVSEIAVDE